MFYVEFSIILFCLSCKFLSSLSIDSNSEDFWSQHKRKYGLTFDEKEELRRKAIFLENWRLIHDFNSKNTSMEMAINKFGHMKPSEVITCLDRKFTHRYDKILKTFDQSLPVKRSVDWREYGAVTRVKEEGSCSSCYAFSAVGAIESHTAIRKGVSLELSEQEIVDCSKYKSAKGCNGGYPESAYEYAVARGIEAEIDYNYTGKVGPCKTKKIIHPNRLLSYVEIPGFNEDQLIRALSFVGPVSVQIDANHLEFLFYTWGVLDIESCSTTNLNHAVLVVGYNLDVEKPYYIVKNSFGKYWGDYGYIKIAMKKNMCGVATAASYPIVK